MDRWFAGGLDVTVTVSKSRRSSKLLTYIVCPHLRLEKMRAFVSTAAEAAAASKTEQRNYRESYFYMNHDDETYQQANRPTDSQPLSVTD